MSKRFPDALTKTVPIWCAVLSGAVARVQGRERNAELNWSEPFLPLWIMPSERDQIKERISRWISTLMEAHEKFGILDEIAERMTKPLRAMWYDRTSALLKEVRVGEEVGHGEDSLSLSRRGMSQLDPAIFPHSVRFCQ